jgi:Uma2 family endonuclease
MATETLPAPETKLPDGYPFHIGTRLVNHRDAAGKIVRHEYVPLTLEDYLHPQEEDKFYVSNRHSITVRYLGHALELNLRDRPRFKTFIEQRVDWQLDGIEPHAPDVVVLDGYSIPYDDMLGTVPVRDLGCTPLAVFEVTSEATRQTDFGDKLDEFLDVGIPYYFVIDVAAPNRKPVLLAMQRIDDRYRLMPEHPRLGFMIPELKLYFRWESDRLIAADREGNDIPDSAGLGAELEASRQEAKALAKELAILKAKLNEAE